MKAIRERFEDWKRERRIRALVAECKDCLAHGEKDEARALSALLRDEVNARSPGQVERMERASYLRLDEQSRRIFDRARRK